MGQCVARVHSMTESEPCRQADAIGAAMNDFGGSSRRIKTCLQEGYAMSNGAGNGGGECRAMKCQCVVKDRSRRCRIAE
jgi:hypothetical protein